MALKQVSNADQNVGGVTFEEWTQRWWQWFCGQSIKSHPVLTGDYSKTQQPFPDVTFLVGSLGGNPVTRNLKVEKGTYILCPTLNVLFTEPEEKSEKNSPPSQADLLNLASGFPNAEIVDEIATVDSQSLQPVQIIGKDTFSIRLPFPNIWAVLVENDESMATRLVIGCSLKWVQILGLL